METSVVEPESKCPKCGTALSRDGEASICPKCVATMILGRTVQYFGDYELLEEIGRGGMGVVYRARQSSLNRPVALKMMIQGGFASPEFVRRFQNEAETAASLQHPNIVAIYEVGLIEGLHYFSMDYIDGPSLAEVVREGPLPTERAARYVELIAEAVHHAHQRGILHRDLKPSNVLIDPFDQPRVTDFGLAKRLDCDLGPTFTGQVLGSPGYMPPEQAAGRHSLIGVTSDVYALGAILYHLLTGQAPFADENAAQVLVRVQKEEPAAPRTLNPGIPRDLETICLKCLRKQPDQRYASAAELAADLRHWQKGESIAARLPGAGGRLRSWCGEHPWAVVSTGLVLLALAALGFGNWWYLSRAHKPANHDPVAATSSVVVLSATIPRTTPEPLQSRKLLWFGYSVFKPSAIARIADYSNFVWLRDWTKNENRDQLADEARRCGLKVVLEIPGKQGWDDIKEPASPFIRKHRDVVVAIAWNSPSYNGWTPEQLAADAKRLKKDFPELQCWVECVEKPRSKLDTQPIPPEMDVIVVNCYFSTKPEHVRNKADETLPGWVHKANGRPVLLQWFGSGQADWHIPDGVPLTRPETLRMCAEIAKEFRLAGLVFHYYGDAPDRSAKRNRGIETNPALVEEIKVIAKESGFSRAVSSAPILAVVAPPSDQQPGQRWTNSLGMVFVPVAGTAVQFSIWDARVQDYQAFVTATGRSWEKPKFEQGPTHPAVMVSWNDANAFCAWLTGKEQAEGKLSANQSYRLPADWEWSVAVGLNESRGGTPKDKSETTPGVYPWGTQWPPPRGAGNYVDAAAKRSFSNWPVIEDYEDGYATTSPVGSFAANRFGLYDMGGNVWQRCEDFYDRQSGSRVVRGGSWGRNIDRNLLSSSRVSVSDDYRNEYIGFRCVLVVGVEEKGSEDGVITPQAQSGATRTIASSPAPRPAVVAPPPSLQPNQRRTNNLGLETIGLGGAVRMEFVLIPPGSFMMGSESVTFTKPFYLGKYEVTQEQWQAVMGNNPSHFRGPRLPVESITWNDCQGFLKKIQERNPRRRFALPTTAQWLYAARAGSTDKLFFFGDDTSRLGEYAWYEDNSGGITQPVGAKKPNPWGLYDMHGNVWEWSDDQSSTSATHHLLKGGGWNSPPGGLKFASTGNYRGGNDHIGLRVMMVGEFSR